MFGIALGKLGAMEQTPQVLAGKSTLNQLEQAMHIERDLSEALSQVQCSPCRGTVAGGTGNGADRS